MIDINQITAELFKKCVEDEIMTRSAFLEAEAKIFEKSDLKFKEQMTEFKEQMTEFKEQKKWLIGAFFSTVGLIIAGFGLILTILLHH